MGPRVRYTSEQDLSIQIFTVSSAMVGVCLTVIGLIRVVITLGVRTCCRMPFCCSWSPALPYWALRSRSVRRMHR
jgi:hypothetical protein